MSVELSNVNYFPALEPPKISHLLFFTPACLYSMHHTKFYFWYLFLILQMLYYDMRNNAEVNFYHHSRT